MENDGLVVAMGASTPLIASLIERAGFSVVNVTGAGLANMNFALPDYGMITMTEQVEIIKRINDATTLPLICDLDDGYGSAINVYRTISEVSRLDVGAVFIEDQQNPKRCGHFEEHAIIPLESMVGKIHAAKDASLDPDMHLMIRTDALSATGSFERTLEIAQAYVEAGADSIFIEAIQTEQQIRDIPKRFQVPAVINLVEKGKTPMFPNAELERMGYKIVFYGNALLKASMLGVINMLEYVKEYDTTEGCDNQLMIPSELRHEILKKETYRALIHKYQ
ncbi:MAG: oxaloacetate decarboxylase [Lawsonibacter sp.]|nr:oxaloacetate decarboxylase [Lawsonibacter sp.]